MSEQQRTTGQVIADVIDPPLEPVDRIAYGAGVVGDSPSTGHTFRGQVPRSGRLVLAVEPGEVVFADAWYRGELGELLRVSPYDRVRPTVDGRRCELEVPAELAGRGFVAQVITAQPAADQPPAPTDADRVDATGGGYSMTVRGGRGVTIRDCTIDGQPFDSTAPLLELDSRVGRHRARVTVWPHQLMLQRRYWLPACGRYDTVIVPLDEVRAVARSGDALGRHDVTVHTGNMTVTVRTSSATAADHLTRLVRP